MTDGRQDDSATSEHVIIEPAPGEVPPPHEAMPGIQETRAAAADRRRTGRAGMAPGLALAAALVVVLALVATSPFWAPPLAAVLPWGGAAAPDRSLQQQVAAVEQRLAAAEQARDGDAQRLDRMERQLQAATAKAGQQGAAQDAAQAVALKTLGDRIAALEQRSQNAAEAARNETAALAPMQSTVQRLDDATRQLGDRAKATDQRVAALEAQAAATGARRDRMLLIALGELRAALQTSRPYAAELGTVKALAQGRSELLQTLAPLDGAAKQGLPGTAVLAQRFESVAAPAILHAAAAPQGQSLGNRVLAKLRSLVTVRRTDPATAAADGDPTAAAVATAEAALAKDDLAGAVAALEKLQGPAAQAAQPWLDAARPRLAAVAAVAQASEAVASTLAAAENGAKADR